MITMTNYEFDQTRSFQTGWQAVINRAVFVRATIVAVAIGSILTLVNQNGWVFGSDPVELLQLILVFVLPFCVVAVSQIVALRRAYFDTVGKNAPATSESIFATAASHGIAARAVLIALIFGSLNASIVLADVLLRSANLAEVSVVSLGQAYALPLLFSVLSQVISYRRYRPQPVQA